MKWHCHLFTLETVWFALWTHRYLDFSVLYIPSEHYTTREERTHTVYAVWTDEEEPYGAGITGEGNCANCTQSPFGRCIIDSWHYCCA